MNFSTSGPWLSFARRLAERTLERLRGQATSDQPPLNRAFSGRMLAGDAPVEQSRKVVPLRGLAIRTVGRLPALQRPMMKRIAGLRE